MLALAVVGIGYLALRDTKGPEPAPTIRGGGGGQVQPAPVRPEPVRPTQPATPRIPPERVRYGSLTLELEPRDARVTLAGRRAALPAGSAPARRSPPGNCTKFGLPDCDTDHRPIGRDAGSDCAGEGGA